jgi:hypothetical protein
MWTSVQRATNEVHAIALSVACKVTVADVIDYTLQNELWWRKKGSARRTTEPSDCAHLNFYRCSVDGGTSKRRESWVVHTGLKFATASTGLRSSVAQKRADGSK